MFKLMSENRRMRYSLKDEMIKFEIKSEKGWTKLIPLTILYFRNQLSIEGIINKGSFILKETILHDIITEATLTCTLHSTKNVRG